MNADAAMPILIVDDYPLMVRIMRALLSEIGFHDIDETFNGVEALARLRNRPYGLVIADWNMSPMTGFELLQAIRADGSLRRTPFIMMTAESRTENAVAARKAGVSAYLVKPFSVAALRGKIDSAFLRQAA